MRRRTREEHHSDVHPQLVWDLGSYLAIEEPSEVCPKYSDIDLLHPRGTTYTEMLYMLFTLNTTQLKIPFPHMIRATIMVIRVISVF